MRVLRHRPFPLRHRQSSASQSSPVHLAQVIVHRPDRCSSAPFALRRFSSACVHIAPTLEVGPAERVQVSAILRLQIYCQANHLQRIRQLPCPWSAEHVSQIVQHAPHFADRSPAPGETAPRPSSYIFLPIVKFSAQEHQQRPSRPAWSPAGSPCPVVRSLR